MAGSLLQDDRRARRVGAALLFVSFVLLGASSVGMALRLIDHNRAEPAVPFATVVAMEPEFELFGRVFSLTTVEGPPKRVVVRWGEESAELSVGGIDNPLMPGLARHADWLAVMMIAEGVTSLDGLDGRVRSGEAPSRLVVVGRSAAAGEDPETWGAARYKEYVYTYLELGADGGITRSARTYREVAHDVRSWRHVAAMRVTGGLNTPSSRGVSPLSYPNYAGVTEAMGAMGWTWPVFGLGAGGSIAGVVLFLGSFVRRPGA